MRRGRGLIQGSGPWMRGGPSMRGGPPMYGGPPLGGGPRMRGFPPRPGMMRGGPWMMRGAPFGYGPRPFAPGMQSKAGHDGVPVTVSMPGSDRFSSYRNSLEEYCSKSRISGPIYEVTLTFQKTGETQIFKGRTKVERTHDNKDLLFCNKIEAGEELPESMKEDHKERLLEFIRKRKEDGPMLYLGKVTFGDKTVTAKASQDTEKKAEQCASFEALKHLKVLPGNMQFEVGSQKRSDEKSKTSSAPKGSIDDDHQRFLNGKSVTVARENFIDATHQQGDWYCAACGFSNFKKRSDCRNCEAAKPEEEDVGDYPEFTGEYEGYPSAEVGWADGFPGGWEGGYAGWEGQQFSYGGGQGGYPMMRGGMSPMMRGRGGRGMPPMGPGLMTGGMGRGMSGMGGEMSGMSGTDAHDPRFPMIQLPGSPGFSSFKNSLQEYCLKRSFSVPEYTIKKTNPMTLATEEYTRDEKAAKDKLVAMASGNEFITQSDEGCEFMATVTFDQNSVSTSVAMRTEISACQRAAFTALKVLKYIPPTTPFEQYNRSTTGASIGGTRKVSEADFTAPVQAGDRSSSMTSFYSNSAIAQQPASKIPWKQPAVSKEHPFINLPGTMGFSSYKNSLQEYCHRMRVKQPDPVYKITTRNKLTGEVNMHVGLGKKRQRQRPPRQVVDENNESMDAAHTMHDQGGFKEQQQRKDDHEYFAKVEFYDKTVDGGAVGSDTEKGAEQRAAFEALKYLGYMPPDAPFVYINKPPTAEELATPHDPNEAGEHFKKIPIISGGTLPPLGLMPPVSLPGQPTFRSFRESLREFCGKIKYEPPTFELKPYMAGMLGSVYFTAGFVSTDIIEYNEKDANERAAFQALKFLRYIPIETRFPTDIDQGRAKFHTEAPIGGAGPWQHTNIMSPMKKMRLDGPVNFASYYPPF